jgi:hypothetical protein
MRRAEQLSMLLVGAICERTVRARSAKTFASGLV